MKTNFTKKSIDSHLRLSIAFSDEIVVTIARIPSVSRLSNAVSVNGHFEGFEQVFETLEVIVFARFEARVGRKIWKLGLHEIVECVIFLLVFPVAAATCCQITSFLIPRRFTHIAQIF